MDNPQEIAATLTKRSKRALVRIPDEGILDGGDGPNWKDAYSLWWGKDGPLNLLLRPVFHPGDCWLWKLTPLGIAVRDALLAERKRQP